MLNSTNSNSSNSSSRSKSRSGNIWLEAKELICNSNIIKSEILKKKHFFLFKNEVLFIIAKIKYFISILLKSINK
jgi:hypothetical protein